MGRGISKQQREILSLAKAFNATRHGGSPTMQAFDQRARPGEPFPRRPDRLAVAELAWAPQLPDYHDGFGLWVLCGFRSRWGVYENSWDPATVSRKRRVSFARAVDGLVERGLLVEAMQPGFVLSHFCGDGVVSGYGKAEHAGDAWRGFEWKTVRDTAPESLREFWKHGGDSVPAYWLTQAGHDAAGELWTNYKAEEIVEAHAESRKPFRYGGRGRAWWDYASPDAAEAASKRLAATAKALRAAI